jgi:hypothetical protein
MVYSYFADYAKKAAHLGIEYAFPRTGAIALISGVTGWYAYQYSMTYSQGILAETIAKQFEEKFPYLGRTTGHLVAPSIVPWVSPYISERFSLGVSLATSLTLNIIAEVVFGIKARKDIDQAALDSLVKITSEKPFVPSTILSPEKSLAFQASQEKFPTEKNTLDQQNFGLVGDVENDQDDEDFFEEDSLARKICCWNRFC